MSGQTVTTLGGVSAETDWQAGPAPADPRR